MAASDETFGQEAGLGFSPADLGKIGFGKDANFQRFHARSAIKPVPTKSVPQGAFPETVCPSKLLHPGGFSPRYQVAESQSAAVSPTGFSFCPGAGGRAPICQARPLRPLE